MIWHETGGQCNSWQDVTLTYTILRGRSINWFGPHIQNHYSSSSSQFWLAERHSAVSKSTTNKPLTALTVQMTESGFLPRASHLHLINRPLNAAQHQDEVETIPVTQKMETCFQGSQRPTAEPISAFCRRQDSGEEAERWHSPSLAVSSPGSWREAEGKHLLVRPGAGRTRCVFSSLRDAKQPVQGFTTTTQTPHSR